MGDVRLKRLKGFEKGVNLGGWFSQNEDTGKEHYDTFITGEDLDIIAGWGCDHVRLPIDYALFVDKNGNFKESGFDYVERAIGQCRERNLNTVLDLNKVDGFAFYDIEDNGGFFYNELLQEKFYELWERIAARFGKYSDSVAFELLSDVTEAEYSMSWNNIIKHSVQRIRYRAPLTLIIFGGTRYNSCTSVNELPNLSDKRIAYTFHFNGPHIFTHQGAKWLAGMTEDFRFSFDHTYREYMDMTVKILGRITGFSDVDIDENEMLDSRYFDQRLINVVKIAAERDKYLYCGEYGVVHNADPHEALKWFMAINKTFVKYNIARAVWTYKKMSFGIADPEYEPVIDELVKYL
ncbi:MAG: cellulase family glycosylhydrolase [Lachnospiraceae bacterium]|nr:cellulase family glycosylhydrolase [Lachnospiraceae bacterium]